MACRLEENLSCPVCHDIYKQPVILSCSHSFCKACWQRCWTDRGKECPVCRTISVLYDPPLNLALKNMCEDFLLDRTERRSTGSADLCSQHAEKLKLFCLDHQQPVCLICSHSNLHTSHIFRPIDEAALDYKKILQELLKPSKEKLELFNDIKGNFNQTAKDIELQAQDTERQINDVFLMLQKFLQEEKEARMAALRKEKEQKVQMMKRRSEALSREIAPLSDTVRATEEVLRAKDLSFLQRYKTAAERVQIPLPDDPQPTPRALIDMSEHLNNLSLKILDSVKEKATSTLNPPQRKLSDIEVLCPTRSSPCLMFPSISKFCNGYVKPQMEFNLSFDEDNDDDLYG
ncbi:E3 ubiquitin-protein ligase TRIM39-like [Micropterus dolomieu]|uniref:E3 ubiquitin-protein ligase TRIM39-like n=1 Tax=Micropterus dolomieu TaxID=147949 RepID=UPI001E8E15B5|nr:E3 ubiquitin-protein ligase TRIM39-like [Micropterus dolomieu]